MQEIINHIQIKKYPINEFDAVEVFAREGNWVASTYSNLVKNMEAWEINPAYIQNLHLNIPNAVIRNVDSIEYIDICKNKFNFISIDNPQGLYGENYCENFEVLDKLEKIMSNKTIVIFLINMAPYDRSKHRAVSSQDNYGDYSFSKWMERRNNFYQIEAQILSTSFITSFYINYFKQKGFAAEEIKMFPVPSKINQYPSFLTRCMISLSSL